MEVDNILIPTCLWYEWLLSWDNIFHYGLFFSIMIRGRPFFFFGLFFVLKSTLYLLHRPNAFFQLWWERLFVVICFKIYSGLITKAEWIFKRTTFLLFVLKSTQYLLHQAKWKNGKGDTNKSTRATRTANTLMSSIRSSIHVGHFRSIYLPTTFIYSYTTHLYGASALLSCKLQQKLSVSFFSQWMISGQW